jgi:POT family proton-dependent oligopeptide transporter
MTIGELLLAPIGLSVVSKLAPPRWVGVLFGLWFASSALGNWLAGAIGHLWIAWPHAQFFAVLALILLLTATILATQLGWLRRTIR